MNSSDKIGIDFIGFPKGKLGIGDQVRSLMRLALHSGYEINAIDCYHPSDKLVNDNHEFDSYISTQFKYPLRIYSLTQNHIGALIYRYGTKFFDNEMNIFHLAWEFDQRPTQLDSALRFSDEIWGISTFTSKAFTNEFGIPVFTMPNSIEIKPFKELKRRELGLPEDKFLFCISMDMNSWLTRKNPFASIQAFKTAFGESSSCGLVIKISNVVTESPMWNKLLDSVKGMSNVYIFDTVLERAVLNALFSCCDAYISLHRSEGFGLGIAENMLLEKPVICTGYSGNMDFCTNENAFLVDYDIVDVNKGEYNFAEGFKWADPSINSAAMAMKSVYTDQQQAKVKAQIAQTNIAQQYSTETLAKHFDNLVGNFISRKYAKY